MQEPEAVVVEASKKPEDAKSEAARAAYEVPRVFRYIYTWQGVVVLCVSFVATLCLLATAQGMGYGRFDIRGYDCYNPVTYYKLGENITQDLPTCQGLTYPYRLRKPWIGSRTVAWIMYIVHQFGQWIILVQVQQAHDRGEIGWPDNAYAAGVSQGEAAEPPSKTAQSGCPVGAAVNKYAVRMFCLNMGAVVLKLALGQFFYDGLASDVPEWSALYSVALWILFACIIRLPNRGLLLGYFTWLPHKPGIVEDIVPYIRKFHGYGFSFGTTYNFWYHPVEGSPGFIFGYLYQFCMILQSGFLFHPMHKNKWWGLILELGVIPHSVLVAIFSAGQGWSQAFQFGYGFTLFGLLTHLHGLDLSKTVRSVIALLVIGSIPLANIAVGRKWYEVAEVARMSISPAIPWLAWIAWLLGSIVMWPLRPLYSRAQWSLNVFWFLIWVAHMAVFLYVGPKQK